MFRNGRIFTGISSNLPYLYSYFRKTDFEISVHSEPTYIGECSLLDNHVAERGMAVPARFYDQDAYHSHILGNTKGKSLFARIADMFIGAEDSFTASRKFHKKLIKSLERTSLGSGRLYRYPKPLIANVEIDVSIEHIRDRFNSLEGRSLLRNEAISSILRGSGEKLSVYGSDSILDIAANIGLVSRMPSVGYMQDGSLRCNRCGSVKGIIQRYCPSCYSERCWVCTSCEGLGEARECKELYLFPVRSRRPSEYRKGQQDFHVSLDFDLTRPQNDASTAVIRFVEQDVNKECLIWAVCGAGKTEVVFKAIEKAIRQGKRVLYAIPRRDVVVELAERMKKSFGDLHIAVLYGGGPPYEGEPQLVLSTTHQVLRFYDFFDLAVIDEVDAFPYNGSEMLVSGVKRALRSSAQLIYMTATPDKVLKRKIAEGRLSLVTIPARHHGYPLPLPRMLVESILESDKQFTRSLPDNVRAFISESLSNHCPLFIFAPTVSLVNSYYNMVLKEFPEIPTSFCHAGDPDRDSKREGLKSGRYCIIVTTSIMERGITIPGCNVLVLNADYAKILDERALVQMAGRVGRTTDKPRGSVLFVGSSISDEMRQAVADIKYMNDIASSKGYVTMGGN